MAVVYSSDLSNANSSASVKSLDSLAAASSKMSTQIEGFISASKEYLKGGGYDAVRSKLNVYADALGKQAKLCDILVGNTKSANNTFLNYMEGYTKLDDTELEKAKRELSNAYAMLSWLKSTSKVWVLDKKTNEKTQKNRRNGTDSQIESYEEIIKELDKLVKKLDGLSAADTSAFSILSGSGADVDTYYNCANGLSASTFDL